MSFIHKLETGLKSLNIPPADETIQLVHKVVGHARAEVIGELIASYFDFFSHRISGRWNPNRALNAFSAGKQLALSNISRPS